jgi:two-component system cell cycle response regulator
MLSVEYGRPGSLAMKTATLTPSPRRRAAELGSAPQNRTLDRGLLFTASCIGAYLAWLFFGHGNAYTNKIVSDVVSIVLPFGGLVWSLRGARGSRTKATLSANLLSFSLLMFGGAASIYTYYDLVLHEQPFPSWADAGYLLNSLAVLVAIMVLPYRPVTGILRVRVLLDSLMILAALVTFNWFFALGPTVLAGDQTLIGKVLGASYPIMDLAMMFCMAVLAGICQDPALRRARNLIFASVLAYVIADTAYLYQNLKGTYEAGQPLDAGWFIANLLFAQAAVTLRSLKPNLVSVMSSKPRGSETSAPVPSFWRMLLPYSLVPAVAGIDVYVWHEKVSGGLAAGVYIGSGILLALILARQIFAIAENTRLYRFLQEAYRELEALATTDGMTGLWNHRTFHEQFLEELSISKRAGTSVALLLIDVDRFKSYNDSFGHPAGDEALRVVARLLKTNVREDDLPARYGGEEFAAILPATNAQEAVDIAERIRKACEAETFPCRPVTLSIGIVVSDDGNVDTMIERADQALYMAKRNGRNQVVLDGSFPSLRLETGLSKTA